MIFDVIVKPKKFTYFIGIDVSRNELDYAVLNNKRLLFHKEAKNEPADILEFVNELKSLPNFTISKSVFCMEHTGFYCNHLLSSLKKIKANIVIENSLQIKNSLGTIRGKDDKIDAIRIANYALKNKDELKLWVPKRNIVMQLSALFSLRNRMLSLQVALKTPLKEQTAFIKKGVHKQNEKLCNASAKSIRSDLDEIDKTIDLLIASDENLKRLFKIITSVPNIGRITAIQIIISTNEYKDITDPKKFACYAGIAPFKKESGNTKGKARVSHIANKKVKALLHICALGSLRSKGELWEYYTRKTEVDKKPKMAVINAIRYKLILRVFACLKENRCFEFKYCNPIEIKQQVN